MALKGNLRDFSTTQLLNLISLARKTGTLTMESGETASLAFKEGKLIYATVGAGPDGQLTTALQRAGKLTEDRARAIREHTSQFGNDKGLAIQLINAGVVSQNDIVQSVRNFTLEIVYRVFTWSEGLFRFDANTLPGDDRITVSIDLESVIMEGSRRMKEWERLQDELPNLDMALKFTDRPDARLRNINLNVEEWRVISFINPRNSIRQIAQATHMNDFQIRRIVYGMLQAGLVELVRPEGVELVPPGGRPAAPPGTARTAGAPTAAGAGAPAPAAAQQRPDQKRNVVMRLIDRIRRI
jgi:hypothetical protein